MTRKTVFGRKNIHSQFWMNIRFYDAEEASR